MDLSISDEVWKWTQNRKWHQAFYQTAQAIGCSSLKLLTPRIKMYEEDFIKYSSWLILFGQKGTIKFFNTMIWRKNILAYFFPPHQDANLCPPIKIKIQQILMSVMGNYTVASNGFVLLGYRHDGASVNSGGSWP